VGKGVGIGLTSLPIRVVLKELHESSKQFLGSNLVLSAALDGIEARFTN